ncbi:hypothetical protein OAS86_06520 [Gammaproteobacteria bacterium]|nr:hypothetical protein [Gammaproteobacteria bacterium]
MKKFITSLLAIASLSLSTVTHAGESGSWARITELQWNVNAFRVVLDRDIDTTCTQKNVVAIMDPSMDPYQFDVRPELTYKTVVSQLTAAYYENKEVYFYFRDDQKGCAWGSSTVLTGFGVR